MAGSQKSFIAKDSLPIGVNSPDSKLRGIEIIKMPADLPS